MSEESEWILCGVQLIRRASITGAKWHRDKLYVQLQGSEFMSIEGHEAGLVWAELIAQVRDLSQQKGVDHE